MTPLVQQVLAYSAVAIAAIWLVVRAWQRRVAAACDGCSPKAIATRSRGRRPKALRVLR